MLTKHALNTSSTSVDLSICHSYPPIPSKHILILVTISCWKSQHFDFGRLFHEKYQNHTLNDPFSSFHKITCMNIHKTVPNSWWVILRVWFTYHKNINTSNISLKCYHFLKVIAFRIFCVIRVHWTVHFFVLDVALHTDVQRASWAKPSS